MTNNYQQPITKVRAFAEIAENRGCYSKSQRGNLETAWTIFLKSVSDKIPTIETATVEHIQPMVEPVFRTYGNDNRVSPSTVRAYQTRVKRLLEDFIQHNGGDFMAWKESLSRTTAAAVKSKQRKRVVREEPDIPDVKEAPRVVSHRIVLSGGREGSLVLPLDVSESDIEPVWQQLEALKTLTHAQIVAAQPREKN